MAFPFGSATTVVLTVTTAADSGTGSLRQAITNANASANSPRRIVFHIAIADPGFDGKVFTIAPASALPLLTHDTSIDGSTQTAFSGNTNTSGPEAVLTGGAGRPPVSFSGISMSGDNNAVKFLVVNGFGAARSAGYGVDNTPSGNQFIGNYLGTDATGTTAVPNGVGILVHGFASPGVQASGNVIQGNIISASTSVGISLCDAALTQIVDNKIGVDRTGANPLGNGTVDGGPGSTSPVPVCATPLSRTTPSASTSATGSSMSPTTAFAALVTRTTASPATPSTTTAAWRDSLGIAAQLDANSAATPYDLFLDQVSFTR